MSLFLYWQSNPASAVNIYRASSYFSDTNLPPVYATLPGNAQEFEDTDVEAGQTWFYRIELTRGEEKEISGMYELVVGKYTGLGNAQIVNGTRDYGFFGNIASSSFITGDDLADAIGLTAGTVANATTTWKKFSHLGRTLFIPTLPIRTGLSWDDIYAAGAVFGSGDAGYAPPETHVEQSAVVTINQRQYRVRLMTGALEDNVIMTDTNDGINTQWSEWNELMYRLCSTNPNSQAGDNWRTFSEAQLGIGGSLAGRGTWCQERNESGQRIIRGLNGLSNAVAVTSSASSNDYGWRPVLELIAPR